MDIIDRILKLETVFHLRNQAPTHVIVGKKEWGEILRKLSLIPSYDGEIDGLQVIRSETESCLLVCVGVEEQSTALVPLKNMDIEQCKDEIILFPLKIFYGFKPRKSTSCYSLRIHIFDHAYDDYVEDDIYFQGHDQLSCLRMFVDYLRKYEEPIPDTEIKKPLEDMTVEQLRDEAMKTGWKIDTKESSGSSSPRWQLEANCTKRLHFACRSGDSELDVLLQILPLIRETATLVPESEPQKPLEELTITELKREVVLAGWGIDGLIMEAGNVERPGWLITSKHLQDKVIYRGTSPMACLREHVSIIRGKKMKEPG